MSPVVRAGVSVLLSASGMWWAVLTIGKLGATRGRLQYYEQQVAAGIEDYYAGRGEARGDLARERRRGAGTGRGRTGRAGWVLGADAGRKPGGREGAAGDGGSSTVAGIDLTFSAPKSVSVLFAVAGEEISARWSRRTSARWMRRSAYLEREACCTRRGRGGVERVRGEGFVAASYRHRMSRAGDPQLHTHVVVANLTRARGQVHGA